MRRTIKNVKRVIKSLASVSLSLSLKLRPNKVTSVELTFRRGGEMDEEKTKRHKKSFSSEKKDKKCRSKNRDKTRNFLAKPKICRLSIFADKLIWG